MLHSTVNDCYVSLCIIIAYTYTSSITLHGGNFFRNVIDQIKSNQIKSNVPLIQKLSNRNSTIQDKIRQYSQYLSQNSIRTIKLQSVRCDKHAARKLPIM